MNSRKHSKVYFLTIAVLFLSGCEPHFVGHYFVSLEGKMANAVIDRGYLEIGSAHFFNKEVNTKYELKFDGFTLSASVLQNNLPTILFRLKNESGIDQELSITSNHPCYSQTGAGMKLDLDDENQFIGFVPDYSNYRLAIYKWAGFDPERPITLSLDPPCKKALLPSELTISIVGLGNGFGLVIPIKINNAGFYMYVDGV